MMHYRCPVTALPRCANDRPTMNRKLPVTVKPSEVTCKRCRKLSYLDDPNTPAVLAEAESR